MSSYEVLETPAEGAGLRDSASKLLSKVCGNPKCTVMIIAALVVVIVCLVIYIVVDKTAPAAGAAGGAANAAKTAGAANATKTAGFTAYADQHLGHRRGSSLSWR